MDFPNINIPVLALDTETCDPGLVDFGPGFLRGDAHVVGLGLYHPNFERYYPFAHTGEGENVAIGPVTDWIQAYVSDPSHTILCHNAQYDLAALDSMGITVKCHVIDTMAQQALIDEELLSYSLDSTARYFGLEPKLKSLIEEALPRIPRSDKPDWARIGELPVKLVGDYCVYDCKLTYQVWERQEPLIVKDDLSKVAKLESDLVPVLFDMYLKGVPIDLEAVIHSNENLKSSNEILLSRIKEELGAPTLNPFSTKQLAGVLRGFGIDPPQTEKENDSVSNELLSSSGIQIIQELGNYRQLEKQRRDYLEGALIGTQINGVVHPSYFSTRGVGRASDNDMGGTRSGRLSSANFNIQQAPIRHPVFGPAYRAKFKARKGKLWCKADYSTQEPRWMVHFGSILKMPSAMILRDKFIADPNLDYHQATADLIKLFSGVDVGRKRAKTLGLGLNYGMGKVKLAKALGLSLKEATVLINAYHEGVPFVRDLLKFTGDIADSRGFVRTILGRRRRFDSWELTYFKKGKFPVRGYENACAEYGAANIRKSGLHKAMNSVIQGTSAEQTKLAMLELHNQKFDILLQVHDEMGLAVESQEEADRAAKIMEEILPCSVPHKVKALTGDSWGIGD